MFRPAESYENPVWDSRLRPAILVTTAMLAILVGVSPSNATTVVTRYDAGTSGIAPDPTLGAGGSWTLNETEDGDITTGGITAGGVSPDGTTGLNAWNVTDSTNDNGFWAQYSKTLTPAESLQGDTFGWRLTATVRIADDFNDDRSIRISYGEGSTRFIAWLDLDSGDDIEIMLRDDGGDQFFTLTSGGTGADAYHTYEIVYDPDSGMGAFFFDGTRIDDGSWVGQTNTTVGIVWGSGSSGGQGSANFHFVEMELFTHTISGVVFEDADFAGTASNFDGGINDAGQPNVDVELYDNADIYITSTTTDGSGNFSFTGLPDGPYQVRVRSATLGDPDSPPAGGYNASVPGTWPYPLADMTWGYSSALIGGQDHTVDDTATGDNAGPGDTYVTVTVSGADVSGVNFGFCYELIVNVDDDSNADSVCSKQGTLRQFIKNSNAIFGVNKSWFQIPSP